MSTAFQNNRPVLVDSELPAQTPVKEGNALITNGATASWNNILAMIGTKSGQVTPTALLNTVLPSQTGNSGKALVTNGSNASWGSIVTGSNGIPGYVKLPNGLIIQWFRAAFDATGVLDITFPTPFTTTVFHVSGHALLSAGPPFSVNDVNIIGWDANNTTLTTARVYSINSSGAPQSGTEVFLAIGV